MDMPSFRAFCHETFPFVAEQIKTLRDGRTRPRIGVISICWSLCYGGLLGLGSLLGIEQLLRTRGGKCLFGTHRPLVSDSTRSRSLSTMAIAPLRALLQSLYERARTLYPSRLPVGMDRLRVGMIEGSCFGRLRASCCAQIGAMCLMADRERIQKMGKERSASHRLLERLSTRLGKRFVDLLL